MKTIKGYGEVVEVKYFDYDENGLLSCNYFIESEEKGTLLKVSFDKTCTKENK